MCRTIVNRIQQSSLVHVYFKNLGVTQYSRDQLYTWSDIVGKNSYLSYCIIYSHFSTDIKIKNFKIKNSFVRPERMNASTNILVLIL